MAEYDFFDDIEENKKKKKKEKDPEIIEMMGGKKAYKRKAQGLREYIELCDRMILIQDIPPEEAEKSYKAALKMVKDMEKGYTYMIDKDRLEHHMYMMSGDQSGDY